MAFSSILPPEEERRRLFEAFTQTLQALEGQPLILFIDDLHWADQATLDWLVYFVDRLRHEPLLLVGALLLPMTAASLFGYGSVMFMYAKRR